MLCTTTLCPPATPQWSAPGSAGEAPLSPSLNNITPATGVHKPMPSVSVTRPKSPAPAPASQANVQREDSPSLSPTGSLGGSTLTEASLEKAADFKYSGPPLSFPVTPKGALQLLEHFRARPRVPLHPTLLAQLLREAIALFRRQCLEVPCSEGGGMVPDLKVGPGNMVVVGDLHGHLADLLTIFHYHGAPDPMGTQYLFNGDFVDRGTHGIEILILLLVYKLAYPTAVHLNRGNHEDGDVQRLSEDGFVEEMAMKYGPAVTETLLLPLFLDLFQWLPLASVLGGKTFVVHGGLPRYTGVSLQHLRALPPLRELPLLPSTAQQYICLDLLWNDPAPAPGFAPGPRGPIHLLFGPDVTADFLRRNGLELVVRSHQVPPNGRGILPAHDGRLVTVFSASNYCGVDNTAGVLVFRSACAYSDHEYQAPPLDLFMQWAQSNRVKAAAPASPEQLPLSCGDPGMTIEDAMQLSSPPADAIPSRSPPAGMPLSPPVSRRLPSGGNAAYSNTRGMPASPPQHPAMNPAALLSPEAHSQGTQAVGEDEDAECRAPLSQCSPPCEGLPQLLGGLSGAPVIPPMGEEEDELEEVDLGEGLVEEDLEDEEEAQEEEEPSSTFTETCSLSPVAVLAQLLLKLRPTAEPKEGPREDALARRGSGKKPAAPQAHRKREAPVPRVAFLASPSARAASARAGGPPSPSTAPPVTSPPTPPSVGKRRNRSAVAGGERKLGSL